MRKPKGSSGKTERRVERKFSLLAETVRRLDVHAALTGERPARALDRLVDQHMRRFVVSDRERDRDRIEPSHGPRAYQPGDSEVA